MGLPICRETHRFIEPTTVDIRPYDIPEELLQVCGADRNEICPGGGIIVIGNANRVFVWGVQFFLSSII